MVLEPVCCPHCHTTDVVKDGKSGEGKQRYRCRNADCVPSLASSLIATNLAEPYDVFHRSRTLPNIASLQGEGHSLEIGLIPLQIGDVRRWDEQAWHVAHVETYSASTETNNTFHLAVLTPNGTLAHSTLLRVGDQRLLHLDFSSEDFALTWPELDECLPSEGNEAPPLAGWQVERRQEFESDSTDALYELVLVCWCIPINVEANQAA